MRTTYNQLQALRQYYQFQDIDIDRYMVDGQQKQVMLSARELVPDQLSGEAQTWVNQRLVYTHGYGAAASPVAEITFDGLPTFLLQDLPPKGSIPITRPQIYFSEVSRNYVIVKHQHSRIRLSQRGRATSSPALRETVEFGSAIY